MIQKNITKQVGREITGESKVAHMPPGVGGTVHDDESAKRAGLRGGYIVNEYEFAKLTEMLIQLFGLNWLSDGKIDVKYIAPLIDGDILTTKAHIIGEETPGSGRLLLDIWCETQDGEKTAIGQASCMSPEVRD